MIGLDLGPARPVVPELPLAEYFQNVMGAVALSEGPAGALNIWTSLGPDSAACLRLDNNDPTIRYSWRETLVMTLRNIYPVGTMALTSGWSQLQSSGSGLAHSYLGNRAIATSSTAAVAQVTVGRDAPYDLWVTYTGRTSGAYARVEIDGAQDLVNEIDDPASLGFKAFSTYSPVNLHRKQFVKVASGLIGDHIVGVRSGGAAQPGGTTLMIEAVAITGALGDPHILPPVWQSGVAYQMGDEVSYRGTYYTARANGVSGVDGPTHSSGIASDGALEWRADVRTTYQDAVAIDYPSEREYALRFDGTDLGGQTHGFERLDARKIALDGVPWIPIDGLSVGQTLTMVEDLTWADDLATCQLVRTITPGLIKHDVIADGTGDDVAVEWLYTGMLPFVRWDGETQQGVVDQFVVPGALVQIDDYAGINPPNLTYDGVQRIGLTGAVAGRALKYGLQVTGLKGDAFLRPNLDARTDTGSLDWIAKAYVVASGFSFGAGDRLQFSTQHMLRLDQT